MFHFLMKKLIPKIVHATFSTDVTGHWSGSFYFLGRYYDCWLVYIKPPEYGYDDVQLTFDPPEYSAVLQDLHNVQ